MRLTLLITALCVGCCSPAVEQIDHYSDGSWRRAMIVNGQLHGWEITEVPDQCQLWTHWDHDQIVESLQIQCHGGDIATRYETTDYYIEMEVTNGRMRPSEQSRRVIRRAVAEAKRRGVKMPSSRIIAREML